MQGNQPPWGGQPPPQQLPPQQYQQPQGQPQYQQPPQQQLPPQQYQQPQGQPQYQQPPQQQGSWNNRIASAEPAKLGGNVPHFEGDQMFVVDLVRVEEVNTNDGRNFFASEWAVTESTHPKCQPGMKRSHMIRLNDRYNKGPGEAQALIRLMMESVYQQPAMTFDETAIDGFLTYAYACQDWTPHPIRMFLTTQVNDKQTWTHHNYDVKDPSFVMGLTAQPTADESPPPQQALPPAQGAYQPPQQPAITQGAYQPPQPQQGSAANLAQPGPVYQPPQQPAITQGPPQGAYQPPQQPVAAPGFSGGITPPWKQ